MILTPRQLLDRFDGLARGTQLTPYHLTRHDLADAARDGTIRRLRRGVYATEMAHPGAVTAARHGGALTCASALRAKGVWVLEDDDVPHVWLGSSNRAHPHPQCNCVVHYHSGTMALGVAEVRDALIHAYFCHGMEFFFCAFESAWRQRLIVASDRAAIREALPRSAHWLVDFARNDADSGLESLMRLRLHLEGIHVQTQVWIDGVGRVDFVVDRCLIIESDGEQNHDGRSMRHKDLNRDAVASALGYESLRFDYALIRHDWPKVLAAICAALRRARG
jgi:very-short-patch-repair endonuclease